MKYAAFYHHIVCAARENNISIDEELDKVRSYGIGYVELDRDDVGKTDDEIRAFGEMLARHDMSPSSIYGHYRWAGGSEDNFDDDLLIRQALILGSEKIMVIPGFYSNLEDSAACETELRNMIEGMRKLVDAATAKGLTVTIEDFDDKKSPIATMGGMSKFLEAIPDLKVTLDTGNFFFHEEDSLEATKLFKNRIVHVHLKDRYLPSRENNTTPEALASGDPLDTVYGTTMMPCPVGYGHMPIAEIIAELKAVNYDGILSIEHFGVSSYSETIRDSARRLQEMESSK